MRWRFEDGLAIHVEGYNDYDSCLLVLKSEQRKCGLDGHKCIEEV